MEEGIRGINGNGKKYNKNKWKTRALTGVAQWVGCCPTNPKVAGSIPGHKPGLWARSLVGDM